MSRVGSSVVRAHDQEIRLDRTFRRLDHRQHASGVMGRRCDFHYRISAFAGGWRCGDLGGLPFRAIDVVGLSVK